MEDRSRSHRIHISKITIILVCDMQMVQQSNESPHPNPLGSLVTDEFDEALNDSSQPRREWNQVVKANKVLGVKAMM